MSAQRTKVAQSMSATLARKGDVGWSRYRGRSRTRLENAGLHARRVAASPISKGAAMDERIVVETSQEVLAQAPRKNRIEGCVEEKQTWVRSEASPRAGRAGSSVPGASPSAG